MIRLQDRRAPGEQAASGEDPVHRLLAQTVPWATTTGVFTEQLLAAAAVPEQGWKLHVSARVESAAAVLERALPVLLAEGVAFKAVATTRALLVMNSGGYGASQVGKFVTVYPGSDEQAVRLAVALHEATAGLTGPRVPSDRPLRPGSLVHYRYGAFRGRDDGYDLLDPAGRLDQDWRLQFYCPPDASIPDPFVEAGVYVAPPVRRAPLAGRYLVVEALYRSYRGGVFRAFDLGSWPARQVLIKEIWHDVGLDDDGRDASSWGDNEAALLAAHDGDPLLPSFYGRFTLDGNLYLVLEFVEGETVRLDENPVNDVAALAALALGAARALAHLHDIGVVFRDFKTDNLILTPDGEYRLIDFGLAFDTAADRPPVGALGTPATAAPEQWDGARPHPTADVWSWGATLHRVACGPAPADDGDPAPRRHPPVRDVRPCFPAPLAAVIDRALAWDPARRYQSMAEALPDLERAVTALDPEPAAPARAAAPPLPSTPADPLTVARRVGDALCADAEEHRGGLRWATRTSAAPNADFYGPDLYNGTAGVALYLAGLAAATGATSYADAARGAARWLAGAPWDRGRAAPGLHCGEAGVGLFFIRLAALLDEPGYLAAAELRARRLVGVHVPTLDVLQGAAGLVLFLVELAAATGKRAWLERAREAADDIVAQAVLPSGRPGLYWNVASVNPSRPARPFLGFAHGAAGIGLALARLAGATGDAGYRAAAEASADLLVEQAVGWRWPMLLDDARPGPQAQCHGAGGIAPLFVALGRMDEARGAFATVLADAEASMRSGLCCGAAGAGSVLVDAYQRTGEGRFLDGAQACARRLQPFAHPDRPGVYRLAADGPTVSPDLLQGYAGVGAFHLRLAAPASAPDLIMGPWH